MLAQYTFYRVLGLPIIAWGGMFTFLLLLATALVAYLTVKNIKPIPVKYHVRLAILTIVLSLLHAVFAILSLI